MAWSFLLALGLILAACGGGDDRASDSGGSPGDGTTNTTVNGSATAVTPTAGSAEREQATLRNGRVACSERIVGGDTSQIFSYAPDGSDRVQMTVGGYNIMPAWSWDGARILFASNTGGGAMEIWSMDADGANPRQLTFNTPGGSFTPVESPDGARIAFSSLRRDVGHPEVWVMNADGSDQRQITAGLGADYPNANVPPGRSMGRGSPSGRASKGASVRCGRSMPMGRMRDG